MVLVCFVFILRTRAASPDVASVALLAEDEAAAAAAPTAWLLPATKKFQHHTRQQGRLSNFK